MAFTPIPLDVFEERTGINKREWMRGWSDAEVIVSLRQIKEIISVQLMPLAHLEQLLRRVCIHGDSSFCVYKDCVIQPTVIDPTALQVSQTFVERLKYQAMLETFNDIFREFCAPRGISNLPAILVLGKTEKGALAIAQYLPPLIEANSIASGEWLLLDGIHRNFLMLRVGAPLQAILIKNVQTPFPCEPNVWEDVVVVETKPPKEKRFINLREELFRDLKSIGIDG